MTQADNGGPETYRTEGNDEFKAGNFLKAAVLYTKAIKADPSNSVLYSNRCAALLKLNKVTKALDDANTCIKLSADWEKGYFRKGAALEALQRYDEALEAYQQAARLNPNSAVHDKVRSIGRLARSKQSSGKIPAWAPDTSSQKLP